MQASRAIEYRVLDRRIRSFGYLPDEAELLPADIVLIASDGGKAPRWIEATQRRGGFAEDHARWTHAALYIGNDRVVEATPIGGSVSLRCQM